MSGLIEGLPDSVALLCLARVPFYFDPYLLLVCRSWRDAVCSPEFFKARQEVPAVEFLSICTGVREKLWQLYDPLNDIWVILPDIPSETRDPEDFAFVSTAGKLFVLGGDCTYYDRTTDSDVGETATDAVWSYDPILGSWDRRASMLLPRSHFACCVLEGKIVVAGGLNSSFQPISNAEIYDPETDVWVPLPDLPSIGFSASGVVIGGKLHVFYYGLSTVRILENGGCGWAWTVKEYGWLKGPMAVVREEAYVLNDGFVFKLDKELKIQKMVAEAPADCSYFYLGCYFTMIGLGDELYMVGSEEIYVLTVGTETPTLRELPREWYPRDGHTITRSTMLRL
ncbi:F-box/kelch-repeat protein SKIP30-like [Macadamia integrifolia]|uniref:F-box/kelch-repeat protein SKIP30-like n=1 Tax=Macadamia integrifolia TaxID=60698 RepID=UPI001C4EA22C|nr:F-box/kelch-repeat protein SKIP30-like [Macadamia integrifolia]XP_042516078.1 F-box/kelch-repeat protein SKIP30-like [Macadamia integrifolia]XP_042516079.1 F-box/kelch-repeat protein SKIP30-like [Macadamia integrifolia]XP_042516080.1 F-box/kelch-repeat protein SKIP30-like [Macadamia integrifolia]